MSVRFLPKESHGVARSVGRPKHWDLATRLILQRLCLFREPQETDSKAKERRERERAGVGVFSSMCVFDCMRYLSCSNVKARHEV